MSTGDNHSADQLLVAQCQAGNEAAWGQLAARLQERARHVLHKALGRDAVNKGLMEEITVDLLSALFVNPALLDAYAPSGRTLDEYLDYMLNRATKRYYQVRARFKRHEMPLSRALLAELVVVSLPPGVQQELAQSLTAAEKKYMDWCQAPNAEASRCPFSDSYARQLEHRIVAKALGLLLGH